MRTRVLLMPQKNKPPNPLTFRTNDNPGVKCENQKKGCKMRKKSDIKYNVIHFSFFVFPDHFHVFCDKCMASEIEYDNIFFHIIAIPIETFLVTQKQFVHSIRVNLRAHHLQPFQHCCFQLVPVRKLFVSQKLFQFWKEVIV